MKDTSYKAMNFFVVHQMWFKVQLEFHASGTPLLKKDHWTGSRDGNKLVCAHAVPLFQTKQMPTGWNAPFAT